MSRTFLIADESCLSDIDNGWSIQAESSEEALEEVRQIGGNPIVWVELDNRGEWLGQPIYL